jgi:hypothetical protein
MSLEPTLVADVLINLFAAGGAIVMAGEIRRTDPNGPVSRRIAFALWFVAVFFVTRAWSWHTNGVLADALADALASATPLVSLIVAEGLLRRHAPRPLKLVLLFAPIVVFGVTLLPFLSTLVPVLLLLATVLGGYIAIAVLLWKRDTESLTTAENVTIRRVTLAVLLLSPLIVTDFRFIWPDIPVRLGALGALIVLHVGLGFGTFRYSLVGRVSIVAVYAAVASSFAFAYVATGHVDGGADQVARAAATAVAGLLFAGLFSEALGARSERTRSSLPITDATDPDDFRARLAAHPVLGDARILSSMEVEQVDHPKFRQLMAEQRTLRRAAYPWNLAPTDDGVERAISLLTAREATHLALITSSPLRMIAFSLPATAADTRMEAEIEVARVVGQLVYMRAMPA